jgi:hypothetical protein
MSRFSKIGAVLGGYAGALLVTWVVFYIYVLLRKDTGAASGGMQAFGDSLFFVGVFCLLALIPTALALYFLRPFAKFWTGFSIASLALAATGPLAAVLMGRLHQSHSAVVVVGFFGLLKVLGSPLFGLGFVICAVIAPSGRSRWRLVGAAVIEFAVCAYAFLCLLVVGHWLL